MLEIIKEFWPLSVYIIATIVWLARMDWRVRENGKSRAGCEKRCMERVDFLKVKYNDDLIDLKSDLKETMKLSQNMNLNLTSLTSFLKGRGTIGKGGRLEDEE